MGVGDITVGYFVNGDRENIVQETYRLGNTVPAGTYGYHRFEATLPKANAPYSIVTAFVSADGENDRTNDTTSVLYMGYRDGVADSFFLVNSPWRSVVASRSAGWKVSVLRELTFFNPNFPSHEIFFPLGGGSDDRSALVVLPCLFA